MTTVWINTDDRNWGQDGAIFDDYFAAEEAAAKLAAEYGCVPRDLLATLDDLVVESATASDVEDIEREIRLLGPLSAETMAAIAARKRQTHDK